GAVSGGAVSSAVPGGAPGSAPPLSDMARQPEPARHAFQFTRGIYSDVRGRWGRPSWAIDYPKADRQFLTVLRRLTILDAYDSEHAVALDDPDLRRHPFLYMLEVGGMSLTPAEAAGLRGYLLAGGFVFIDDFWGSRQWWNFEQQMRLVLPEHEIVELSLDHPIFRSLYHIREILQVPAVGNWRSRRQTHEQDGYEPFVRAIFDHDGRLMMMINWNTDIGDAWEWAEQPDYPLEFSTFAYQIGANAIVYAMSH
ncbi:MAG: DUF4159 domain-containing protein, partial [Gemmatimonadetes bacterium]|nr:DUF4159 domain-containing protein [Gemmatimonadota bacterium]